MKIVAMTARPIDMPTETTAKVPKRFQIVAIQNPITNRKIVKVK